MGVGLGGSMAPSTSFAPAFNYWNPEMSSPNGYDYGGTDWGQMMLEQSPQTFYYRMGAQMGIPDDNSAFSRWFNQQYGQFLQGYNAYTVSDPINANLEDYSKTLGGYDDWHQRFMDLAPQVRGEDPGSRGAGPVRWIGR